MEASAILMTPLVRTYNQILTQGVPPCWCIGLIHFIYKAGDMDDPGNYRGITVVVILAKLYAMVLEARASAWAEQMKCRAKGQTGFGKNFQTTDQIFVIRTLVQQAKQAKQELINAVLWTSRRLLTWSPATLCGALCNIEGWVAWF